MGPPDNLAERTEEQGGKPTRRSQPFAALVGNMQPTRAALPNLSTLELLALHAAIADELRRRGVTRSANTPVGDLAEHLFCCAFGWQQAPKSMRDVDATDNGVRYQIKGRRPTERNKSRQLGALRDLRDHRFDFLAAVLFHEDFRVWKAALIPHARVVEHAKWVKRTNSWRFILGDAIWALPDVRDVTADLQQAELSWGRAPHRQATMSALGSLPRLGAAAP